MGANSQTAALIARHEAETAALPMNPPREVMLEHATRQARELVAHAFALEARLSERGPSAECVVVPKIVTDPMRSAAGRWTMRLFGEPRGAAYAQELWEDMIANAPNIHDKDKP